MSNLMSVRLLIFKILDRLVLDVSNKFSVEQTSYEIDQSLNFVCFRMLDWVIELTLSSFVNSTNYELL